MATRKSFDEKSKGMHKSRKLIIDTVFGREDNTQRVFGYEKEQDVTKREVGEIWTDSDGKEWEQKDGYKANVTKMDEVREYLKKLTTCSGDDCKTIQYSRADKKLITRTGLCTDCLIKFESTLKEDGTFPFYEDYKITLNKLSYIREVKEQYEENLKNLKDHFEVVNENGTISQWEWQIDINKVKEDLKNDINNAYDAIELLLQRKLALEDKLRELNHSELIKN
jgi:hypothetical protein